MPGLDEASPYGSPQPQLPPAAPPQPPPPHSAHPLGGAGGSTTAGGGGGGGATPPSATTPYPPHGYGEGPSPGPKGKKGQQLWSRMKRKNPPPGGASNWGLGGPRGGGGGLSGRGLRWWGMFSGIALKPRGSCDPATPTPGLPLLQILAPPTSKLPQTLNSSPKHTPRSPPPAPELTP